MDRLREYENRVVEVEQFMLGVDWERIKAPCRVRCGVEVVRDRLRGGVALSARLGEEVDRDLLEGSSFVLDDAEGVPLCRIRLGGTVEDFRDREVEPERAAAREVEPRRTLEVDSERVREVDPDRFLEVDPVRDDEVDPNRVGEVDPVRLGEVDPNRDCEVKAERPRLDLMDDEASSVVVLDVLVSAVTTFRADFERVMRWAAFRTSSPPIIVTFGDDTGAQSSLVRQRADLARVVVIMRFRLEAPPE